LQGFSSAAVQEKKLQLVLLVFQRKLRMQLVRTRYMLSLCNLLPDSFPAPAHRSLAKISEEILDDLIGLFENPIAAADSESKELLCKPDLEFAKPIFDLVDNPHLRPLVQTGVSPCVREDKALHIKGSRSVLTIAPAVTQGQELPYVLCMYRGLLVLILCIQGMFCVCLINLFLELCTYCVCNVMCMYIPCMYRCMNEFILFMMCVYLVFHMTYMLAVYILCRYHVCSLRFWFCAENVCLLDGKMPVSPPIIAESRELVDHDFLLAHRCCS
jgi:hypothetical protein